MEVKIGIRNVARELAVETKSSADDVEAALADALAKAFAQRERRNG